jgi:hypothetical protein
MNGPLFGNTGGSGSGFGQMGDAQAVAAAKNVSLDRSSAERKSGKETGLGQ